MGLREMGQVIVTVTVANRIDQVLAQSEFIPAQLLGCGPILISIPALKTA